MGTPEQRTALVRQHYVPILEEIIYGADSLEHSMILTAVSTQLMNQEKRETLQQISELIEFLEQVQHTITMISTEPAARAKKPAAQEFAHLTTEQQMARLIEYVDHVPLERGRRPK